MPTIITAISQVNGFGQIVTSATAAAMVPQQWTTSHMPRHESRAVSRAHSRAARLAELDPLSRDVQADIAEGLEKHLWRLRAQEALTRAMLVAGEVWPHSAEEPAPSGESRTHRRAVQEGPSPSGPAGHPDVRDGG